MPLKIVRNNTQKLNADAVVWLEAFWADDTYEVGSAEKNPVFKSEPLKRSLKTEKLRPGEARAVKSEDPRFRYVIETIVPIEFDKEKCREEALKACYTSCLQLAKKKRMKSIVLQLMPGEVVEGSSEAAFRAALDSIRNFLLKNEMEVILTIPELHKSLTSGKLCKEIDSYIEEKYVENNEENVSVECEKSINACFDERYVKAKKEGKPEQKKTKLYSKVITQYDKECKASSDLGWKLTETVSDAGTGKGFASSDNGRKLTQALSDDDTENGSIPSDFSSEVMEDHAVYYPNGAEVRETAREYPGYALRASNETKEQETISNYSDETEGSPHTGEDRISDHAGTNVMQSSQYVGEEREGALLCNAEPPAGDMFTNDSIAPNLTYALRKRTGPRYKRSLDDVLKQTEETFQQRMFRIIRERGLKNADIYKKANVQKSHFAKIKANKDYVPKKNTAIAICLALELNLDETRDLLGRAGYTLSPSSKFDLVVQYFIENGIYDVYTIDAVLFDHDLPMVSNY